MKQRKISQQVLGVMLAGMLLVGCSTDSTSEPTIEQAIDPIVEPTVEPTAESTAEPTAEPTVEPTESAPIGANVKLLDQGNGFVEMRDAPHPSAAVIAQLLVDMECVVESGPFTADDITFWKLDCLEKTSNGDLSWDGWIDVTMLEVIE